VCALVIFIFQILRHFRGASRAILVFGGNYPLFNFGFCFAGRPLCRFFGAVFEDAWLLLFAGGWEVCVDGCRRVCTSHLSVICSVGVSFAAPSLRSVVLTALAKAAAPASAG
jgi:hypothetical protein